MDTCVDITYSKQHNKARKDLLRRGAAHPFTCLRLGWLQLDWMSKWEKEARPLVLQLLSGFH